MRRAALLLAVLAGLGCRRATSRPSPAERAPEETPRVAAADVGDGGAIAPPLSGSLMVPRRSVELGVYLADEASPGFVKAAVDATRKRFPGVDVQAAEAGTTLPNALVIAPPIASYAPPSEELLAHFGRGLSPEEVKAAATSRGVLKLTWNLDGDAKFARLREAERLAADLADQQHGFVWDEATRELYARDTWRKRRIDGWEGDIPDIRRHITIHYYETDGGRHRAITLGMWKVGLPDLVVSDVPLEQSSAMTVIIDAVAQLLVEGAALAPGGVLTLDLGSIRHVAARDALGAGRLDGGTGRALVTLVPAQGEEGDPDNRLVELRFPSYPGATLAERQAAGMEAVVGSTPERMSPAKEDDPELAAAAARAQVRLVAVAAAFRKGLPLGERISVKAPFDTDTGTIEWMWIGVTEWPGDVLRGTLQNSPAQVKSLRFGARVEAKQSALADYVWRLADGTKKEGGESIEILSKCESRQ